MAEWFKAVVLKTTEGLTVLRGFESLSLRQAKACNNIIGEVPEWSIGAAC